MHHSLIPSLIPYGRCREVVLKYYIYQARWTRLPLIGNIVRMVAEAYGKNVHGAYLLTLEEANKVIDVSHKLSLGSCLCRLVFKNCTNPVNAEIVIGLGKNVFTEGRPGDYREISKPEAKEILLACHERRLLHTLVRCGRDFYAICNCCPCCCVPLRVRKDYGIANALIRVDNIVEIFQKNLALQNQEGIRKRN